MNGTVNTLENERCFAYEPDLQRNLRNPAMGWQIYEEGWSFKNPPQNGYTPSRFWKEIEECKAYNYANILYIRILWRDIEPQEGRYAWLYDEGFKMYIKKAKKYGLKLAFRVFFDGGCPDWVIRKSAWGAAHERTLYSDDPVFLENLDKFIKSFAEKFDDPDLVDFVDGYGLGKWGEGHTLLLKNRGNYEKVVRSVAGMYAKHFKKVLTVINLSFHDYKYVKPYVFDELGFLPRRDGIGSKWFNDTERRYVNQDLFPDKALIGESCYWFNNGTGEGYEKHFKAETRFPMRNFEEALTISVKDALDNHCNTLDLRVPLQCKFWIEKLPDQVQKFITFGGYRLYPSQIKVSKNDHEIKIRHRWKNLGVGVLPNNHPNWNNKYQLSFVLIDRKGKVRYLFTEEKANPGTWLKGQKYDYVTSFHVPANLSGAYFLCVGITDKTKKNAPGIELALPSKNRFGKWGKICPIFIQE